MDGRRAAGLDGGADHPHRERLLAPGCRGRAGTCRGRRAIWMRSTDRSPNAPAGAGCARTAHLLHAGWRALKTESAKSRPVARPPLRLAFDDPLSFAGVTIISTYQSWRRLQGWLPATFYGNACTWPMARSKITGRDRSPSQSRSAASSAWPGQLVLEWSERGDVGGRPPGRGTTSEDIHRSFSPDGKRRGALRRGNGRSGIRRHSARQTCARLISTSWCVLLTQDDGANLQLPQPSSPPGLDFLS